MSEYRGSGDRITLTGIRVFGRHGVLEHERDQGQEFVVDIVAWVDLSAAATSDALHQTVHYGEMAELAAGLVAGDPHQLIESVAGAVADRLLATWPLTAAEVTLHKPAAPIPLIFDDVAVTVLRQRDSSDGEG